MSQINEVLEDIAAATVAAITGVRVQREDNGGPKQIADFSMWSGEDCSGLLEVSSSTNAARSSQFAALTRHLPDKINGSERAWHLVLRHEGVPAKPLAKQLPTVLTSVERQVPEGHFAQIHDPGTQQFFPNGISAEINEHLYDLGVLFLYSLAPGTEAGRGWLDVQQNSVGGAIGPSLVTEEVNRVLDKPDNQQKLSQSPGPRAEIFVWLNDTIGAMAMTIPNPVGALDAGGEENAPRLPSSMSKVWVGSYPSTDPRPARAIWASTGGAWEICEAPTLAPGAHPHLD